MKHMKHIIMVLVVAALAYAGYMAYQRYYAQPAQDVQVQFLNFGGNYDHDDFPHSSSYERGYQDGLRAAQNE